MPNETEFDWRRFDYQARTSAEWPAIQRRLIRQAREERAKAIRELAIKAWSWLRRAAAGATAVVKREWRTCRLMIRRRKAVFELNALDDRALKDMGLRRCEIYSAICRPESREFRSAKSRGASFEAGCQPARKSRSALLNIAG